MASERLRQQFASNTELFHPKIFEMQKRTIDVYGELPNVPVGTTWATRKECHDAGCHMQMQAGISGNMNQGATSIVMSGGYKDDLDEGEIILYTGTGGQMDRSLGRFEQQKKQDQTFNHQHNAILRRSAETCNPVRVIRGANSHSKWAPRTGFRYDGLYRVTNAYYDKGQDGHRICRFRLERIPDNQPSLSID